MKKIFLLILAAFILGVLFERFTVDSNAGLVQTTPGNDNRCLHITVRFDADPQWKQNGTNTIEVACAGQGNIDPARKKFNPPGCNGGKAVLSPGEDVTLKRCSCFVNPKDPLTANKKGCLVIGKKVKLDAEITKPGGVWTKVRKATRLEAIVPGNSCRVIYRDVKNGNIKVRNPDTYFCGKNEDTLSAGIKINCTPTKICTTPGPVTNVHISCPNCSETATSAATLSTQGDNQ